MAKFLNFLLIVAFIILVALIGINYFADKEIEKYNVEPTTVGRSTGDEINDIITSATQGAKGATAAVTQKISKESTKKEGIKTTKTDISQSDKSTTTTKPLPQVPSTVNQTYFMRSK